MLLILKKNLIVGLGFFISLTLFSNQVLAKPPTEQFAPIWPERGSILYDFESQVFSRKNNEHDFQVWLAIPKKKQPYADVLYFLDGNATIQLIEDSDVNQNKPLPFLVFIGYRNTLLFNTKARAYDDTPLISYTVNQQEFGGADTFATWLRETLQTHVKERIETKPCRQTLWGHSYGGLFTLHLFFQHKDLFDVYFSADPALWWQDGAFIKANTKLKPKNQHFLAIERGSARFFQRSHTPQAPALQASINNWLQKLIQNDTVHITLEDNDLDHGEVFRSSVKKSIKKIQNSAQLTCKE